MLDDAINHPQKLWMIIFILFVLIIVLYMQGIGKKKGLDMGPSAYLGTTLHSQSMAEAIEDVAIKILTQYPTLDDSEQARMVRDQLKIAGMKNVDMYEATIFATITRLKKVP